MLAVAVATSTGSEKTTDTVVNPTLTARVSAGGVVSGSTVRVAVAVFTVPAGLETIHRYCCPLFAATVRFSFQTLAPLSKGGGGAVEDLCRLLLQQPLPDLKGARAALEKLSTGENASMVRQAATASLISLDGKIDDAWNAAVKSPAALKNFLEAAPLIPDPAVRSTAFENVLSLLTSYPPQITAALDKEKTGTARYVRIELPRQGTLTLAEVQIFSDDTNVSKNCVAKQSSTDHGGEAKRALDGNTNAEFQSGTQTHTREGENNPWWEADLQGDVPLSAIVIWNRAGFVERLEGFTLTVLDGERREIFKKTGIPAPQLSSRIEIPHDPSAGVRRAAIRALPMLGKDPEKVFAGMVALTQKNEELPAAAKAIMQLPRTAWSKERAAAAAEAVIEWARKVPVAGRTSQEFIEVVQAANELSALMPPDRAATARNALKELHVDVFVIKTVREQMRYDTPRLVVEAGKPFQIIFENADAMPHNMVFVQPGTLQAVAESVQTQAPDKLDVQGRAYLPANDSRVFAATKLIEAGQRETFTVNAPGQEGDYEYVCTFPGHWAIMRGKLIVTKDVDGYLKEHPADK